MRRVVCKTGEVFTEYKDYLRSKHWQNVKRKYYAEHAYECVRCGWNRNLQLHHKTYERLGKERIEDLKSLCRYCHMKEHGLLPVVRKKWSWKKKLVVCVAIVWVLWQMWNYK